MNRIKELRTKLRYTQLQMAEILGIKQNAYSSIETGKVSLTDRNRTVLESKFHLTPGWLQGADVPMFKEMDKNACMDNEEENRLKQFRIHMNMTQQQMADLLKVGQNTYSRIENGVTAFKDVYKKIIEDKYHLTIEWLSGADVPMFKEYDAVAGIIGKSVSGSNKEKLEEKLLEELIAGK